MYEGRSDVWRTPGGSSAVMHYRADTNDFNTLNAVFNDDEYRLPRGLSGIALDIGAHIGAVTVALALDNPDLLVKAVEPVPANVDLLLRNVAANGLETRVRVYPYAAGAPGQPTAHIRYGFRGTEVATHHAFIGNACLVDDATDSEILEVPSFSLWELVSEPVAWVKIDTEGAEFAILRDPAIATCDVVVGEWHNTHGNQRDIVALLGETHRVTFTGPVYGPGGFRAERR